MSLIVQKLRLQRGWSQAQLAELSGLSARTVQRIEGGQNATAESLKSLAAVFEVDFQELRSAVDAVAPAAASSCRPGLGHWPRGAWPIDFQTQPTFWARLGVAAD